jgi:hypothetical protein
MWRGKTVILLKYVCSMLCKTVQGQHLSNWSASNTEWSQLEDDVLAHGIETWEQVYIGICEISCVDKISV